MFIALVWFQLQPETYEMLRWLLLPLYAYFHLYTCQKDLIKQMDGKQKKYIHDLDTTHAKLGNMSNVKTYAKYNVYKPEHLQIPAQTYWLGWVCMMWLVYFLTSVPDWFG